MRAIATETREAAVQAYADGTPSAEVAAEFGVSSSSVLDWAKAAGVTIRPRGNPLPEDSDVYSGGWILRGGIMVPTAPERRRRGRVQMAWIGHAWDNGTARTGVDAPAGPNHRFNSTRPRSEG